MWDRLRQADIEQAKQQLRLRVDETLRRHAEEIKKLDSDQVELAALNRLLDEFSRKFKTAPGAPAEALTANAQEAPVKQTKPNEDAAATEQEQPAIIPENDEPLPVATQEEPVTAVAEEQIAAATAAGKQNEPATASKRNQAGAANEQGRAATASNNAAADKPPAKARNVDQRDRPKTNFDVFSRAMAKQDRW